MRELAHRAELSAALVSQVERGITDPSLDSLRRIAHSLHIPMFDLFQAAREDPVGITRANSRMRIRSPHSTLEYSRISTGSGKLEVLEGTLAPGASSSDRPWSHPSEECTVVLSGWLVVEVEGTRNRLDVGDSCYFESTRPHRYLNESDELARFIISVTPPSF